VDEGIAERVADIMERHDPVDLERRVSYWREQGWTGYDPDADPYNVRDVERERMRY
jgi:hypothetical protein